MLKAVRFMINHIKFTWHRLIFQYLDNKLKKEGGLQGMEYNIYQDSKTSYSYYKGLVKKDKKNPLDPKEYDEDGETA